MSSQDNQLYEFGPYVIDARSRILLKDGTTVRLTPKAFDTLLVLVQHASQVVEKEQLLKEVWPDIFVEEGSLSHNIHGLRKALGDDSSEPRYIETIPKRGYRFVAPVKITQPDAAQVGFSSLEDDALVIEKHTFARVITEEFALTDLSTQHAPLLPAPEGTKATQALTSGVVSPPRKKRTIQAMVGAGVLAVSAIAVFVYVYVTRAAVTPPPTSRAKSTLVRLSNNSAIESRPVWSPDGRRIAFASNRDGMNEIYVMDADGSNAKRLTNNLTEDVNPMWSPDGHRILFDTERDGNGEIYVMDADGGNQTRLTRNNAFDGTATWSPDGNLIAFASNRDTGPPYNPYNLDIYVMNADGSNVRRIVDDPEYDVSPQWSPDGRKIVFVTGRNGNFDVYEMNADGTEQKNLTADNDKGDGAPVWSHDGNNIAFSRRIDGKKQIFIMDADGGNLKRVTNNAADNELPCWSPDSSKLVFQSDRDGNWEIYTISVDGELAQLTDDAADDVSPDWSPDGNRLAFSSNRNGKQHIYVMNADGSSLAQITNSPAEDTEPAWAPDGKRMAFSSLRDGNKEIYVMNADGTNQRRVTNDPSVDSLPRWSVDGKILFTSNRGGQSDIYVTDEAGASVARLTTMGASRASWSPDGRKVVFVARSAEIIGSAYWLQIYVIDADGSNLKMITRSSHSIFVPKWSADGTKITFVVEYHGARANIFEIPAEGGNLKRLTVGPKFDGWPSYSPDRTKLAFESNRNGNYEIYVMNLR
ncbi:MAG TPA: winged helix-turn-helix domain-containing protein [Pyrinomonadaceae bacterium]|nr:winged helix-turn-helix domain-containing protein [Pyrinomonadaceae bacterium]